MYQFLQPSKKIINVPIYVKIRCKNNSYKSNVYFKDALYI